jgi:hypothetical protein
LAKKPRGLKGRKRFLNTNISSGGISSNPAIERAFYSECQKLKLRPDPKSAYGGGKHLKELTLLFITGN